MALSADLNLRDLRGSTLPPIEHPAQGADTYFRGGIATFLAAGRINIVHAADDETFAGIVVENTVVAAQDDTVKLYTEGVFAFACSEATIANLGSEFHLANASDDPADLSVTGTTGNTSGLCVLIAIIVSGTSGWFKFDSGVVRTVV